MFILYLPCRFALVNGKPVFYSYVVTVKTTLLAILVGFSGSAIAGPFLVCDPYGPDALQPTAFDVTANGRTERISPLTYPNGSSYLRYDLKDLPDGEHVLRVKARNDVRREESAEVEYRLRKKGDICSEAPKPKQKIPPSRTYRGHFS